MMRRRFFLLALAGAVMLGTAGSARADYELQLTVTDKTAGGSSYSATYDFTTGKWVSSPGGWTVSGASVSDGLGEEFDAKKSGSNYVLQFGGNVSNYSVTVSTEASNTPGTPTLAFVNSTNNTVSGSGSGLTIESSAAGFTSPSSPPPLLLTTSSSANTNAGNTATTVNYAGYAGTTLGGSQYTSASGSYSTPSGAGSGSGPELSSQFSASSYTLTDVLTIGSGNAQFGGVSGQVDAYPTPEPSTLITAFAAMPILGFGAWLRRRKQAA